MSQFEKAWKKFNSKPIPNNITFEELKYIIEHFGCEIENDGKHGVKVRNKEKRIRIPIPMHGKTVPPVYIKQVKEALNNIDENKF